MNGLASGQKSSFLFAHALERRDQKGRLHTDDLRLALGPLSFLRAFRFVTASLAVSQPVVLLELVHGEALGATLGCARGSAQEGVVA